MPAPVYPRTPPDPGPAGARLPWWAVALPVVAFAVLLVVVSDPEQAQAASGHPAAGRLIERAIALLSP
ncbi:hypothetical protein [uncultured Streptomyces sp.]|uniref:hypothetical protein n=1 Tax=uncultured Streptomyces sp. TaxID=174707 RepID=UPI00260894D0|nr:hypothetical protein [uncultured Streptomyces sp.]